MRIAAGLVTAALMIVWGCIESEQSEPVAVEVDQVKLAEQPGKVLMAMNPGGKPVSVRPFDDRDNPYSGKYSELDLWIRDNYDRGEESPANWPKSLAEGVGQRAMLVDENGYAIPGLEYLRFELEQRRDGGKPNQRPGEQILYAIGKLPERLHQASLEQRYRLIARFMPDIPQWLALEPAKWALLLPDGSVVTRGERGSGDGYFPKSGEVAELNREPACHYSAEGELLAQTEAGKVWCELFFADFEDVLAEHGLERESVRTTGWFVTFQNLIERSKNAHYLYDGTPVAAEDIINDPDFNSLYEMYGKFIPEMYASQQAGNQTNEHLQN